MTKFQTLKMSEKIKQTELHKLSVIPVETLSAIGIL